MTTRADKIAALRRIVQACDNESSYLHNHPDRLAYRALLDDLEAGEQGWRPGDPRCDECDWGVLPEWAFCPYCGHYLPKPPAESREDRIVLDYSERSRIADLATAAPSPNLDDSQRAGGADPHPADRHVREWLKNPEFRARLHRHDTAPAPTAGDAVERVRLAVAKVDRCVEADTGCVDCDAEFGCRTVAKAACAVLLEKIREPSEHMLRVGEQQQEGDVIAGRKLALKIWRTMFAAAHLSGDQP